MWHWTHFRSGLKVSLLEILVSRSLDFSNNNFIEMQFTLHKTYPSKSKHSVGFYTHKAVWASSLSNFRTFLHPRKKPVPISGHFLFPSAPDKHQSDFCLYGFAYTEHLIQMEPCVLWPLVPGFALSIMFSRVVRVVAGSSASFLSWLPIRHYVDIPDLLMFSPTDGHWGCFHLLAIVDNNDLPCEHSYTVFARTQSV